LKRKSLGELAAYEPLAIESDRFFATFAFLAVQIAAFTVINTHVGQGL